MLWSLIGSLNMLAANSLASAILTSVQVCGTGLNRDFAEKSSEVKICLILNLIALQMCLIMFTSATSRYDLLCLLYCFVLGFFNCGPVLVTCSQSTSKTFSRSSHALSIFKDQFLFHSDLWWTEKPCAYSVTSCF